ncbi:hypothetical protein ISN44_As09g024900 [Arabidopsis suecica]|uniref:Uncharacterized protein n=1 Tax=Arabidopsis suecica TaxID=45249 RepID=A0A8T2AJ17_ARASU|nr:hypothetical protein ISN44_As09g024900 [Arabidopsis suecica]
MATGWDTVPHFYLFFFESVAFASGKEDRKIGWKIEGGNQNSSVGSFIRANQPISLHDYSLLFLQISCKLTSTFSKFLLKLSYDSFSFQTDKLRKQKNSPYGW